MRANGRFSTVGRRTLAAMPKAHDSFVSRELTDPAFLDATIRKADEADGKEGVIGSSPMEGFARSCLLLGQAAVPGHDSFRLPDAAGGRAAGRTARACGLDGKGTPP
jgi:hypothetical protein